MSDIDYIQQLVSCYETKCAKFQKKMKQERDKLFMISSKLYEDYKNKKISKKEFLKKGIDAENNYLNSRGHLQHIKCCLDNCYDLTKIKIDKIAKKNDYKYDVNDYNKIMLLNYINETNEFLK